MTATTKCKKSLKLKKMFLVSKSLNFLFKAVRGQFEDSLLTLQLRTYHSKTQIP